MGGKQNNVRFRKNNRRRCGVSGDLDERTGFFIRQDAKTAKVSSATNEHRLSQMFYLRFICAHLWLKNAVSRWPRF
jgi:hypothetical protein